MLAKYEPGKIGFLIYIIDDRCNDVQSCLILNEEVEIQSLQCNPNKNEIHQCNVSFSYNKYFVI